MSPQKLGQVLNGKTGLSSKAALAVADNLKLAEQELELFVALVQAKHSRSQAVRRDAGKRVESLLKSQSRYDDLQPDMFPDAMDVSYWAAYLATELADFKSDINWIASRLQIPIEKCISIYETLFKQGLVTRSPTGAWTQTRRKFSFGAKTSTLSIRRFYRQALQKAERAIEKTPPAERNFRVTMFPIRVADYPAIVKKIDDSVLAILNDYADSTEPADRVYSLVTAFYPVDHREAKK